MLLNRKQLLPILLCGMTLGTAWAIRGQFGHVQGAAWAGAIGTLAALLLTRRTDWYQVALKATFAGAIGWGIGGMMSYGIVVGYGRGTDFANVYYGLGMLFVIGGMFGLLGGGYTALVLSDTKDKPVNWPVFFSVSIAAAVLSYFMLIVEFGWLMTPPRNEHWAACAGLSVAFVWYCVSRGYSSALRVALITGFGSGFGFAFGNFLQVMGNVSGIQFNFWNVMEYSIGFFGGTSLLYSLLSSKWDTLEVADVRKTNRVPLYLVALVIPLIVWEQSFNVERLTRTHADIMDVSMSNWPVQCIWLAFVVIAVSGGYCISRFYKNAGSLNRYADLKWLFVTLFSVYCICSWLISGVLLTTGHVNQYLYPVNILIVAMLMTRAEPDFVLRQTDYRRFGMNFFWFLVFLALIAIVAINSHGALNGVEERF